jgi:hypothetical protein
LITNPAWLLLKHAKYKFKFTEIDEETKSTVIINGKPYEKIIDALKTLETELDYKKGN